MMKKITVFTPTYNRAHLLPRLYESLCSQTSKNFIWLIIDDGSTDDTERLIKNWQKDQHIEIVYHWKSNGGMHTAHNSAYELIDTDLNICIDSDDAMPPQAVETILFLWSVNNDKSLAGIIGLDADFTNKIIGTNIPLHLSKGTLPELYDKYEVKGDKKLVLKTEIVRQFPKYPEYDGEKLVPLGILYLMIAQQYKCIYTNEILCWVDYQVDGSSSLIFKQYKQSPRGFAYARAIQKKYNKSLKKDIKNSLHMVSSAIFAKDASLLFLGPKSYLNCLLLPFGIIMNFYIRNKIKN